MLEDELEGHVGSIVYRQLCRQTVGVPLEVLGYDEVQETEGLHSGDGG